MDEIDELHTRGLEWGCIANLITKIGDIEEKIEGHWDELLDMLADMIEKEGDEKDPAKITNYDYKTFKWAKTEGFVDTVSNDYIDLLADKLTTNQRRAFDRRIGDNK